MYRLEINKNLDKNFRKLRKKDREMLELIDKKVQEILDNPYRFKPLKKPLQNIKWVEGRIVMKTAEITTATKMLESLPEITQKQVVEHLREYIATIRDEAQWDRQFQNKQAQLTKTARKAKEQIAAGNAQPLDVTQL